MASTDRIKSLLDHQGLRSLLTPVASALARWQGNGVRRVSYNSGIWMHDTRDGFFAYHRPFIRLDMTKLDIAAQANFFWGYRARPGDVVIDVGAGVGEETLTFSRAVGQSGKVVCIEAHPRTYRCLEKLVEFNCLKNVIPIHAAITDRSTGTAMIVDSSAYLSNRLSSEKGIRVRATTIDAIHQKLSLGRVQFLKMNIEGAERYAIGGMTETLSQTEVLCVSCHDFLAQSPGDDSLRTKELVKEFLQDHGFDLSERSHADLPPYIRDQVWASNRRLIHTKRAS